MLPTALKSPAAPDQLRFVSADEIKGVPVRVYLAL
jgi:hypothetical protein